jgi:SH3 domain protein
MTRFTIQIFTVVLSIFLLFAEGRAETMYVNDNMKITFRAGPGNDHKITALLTIGEPVEVIQPAGDWTQVQLPDGKEGWVLTQYLTSKVPCNIELESLKKAHQRITETAAALKDEHLELTTKLKTVSDELSQRQQELDTIQTQFDTLQKESAHFIELKANYEKAVTELAAQKKRGDALNDELSAALKSRQIKWFIGGAGTLLLGMILGFSSKREKRRSSLL